MNMQTTEPVKCIKKYDGKGKNDRSYRRLTFAWMGGSQDFFVDQNMTAEEGKMYNLSVAIEKERLVLKGFMEATELKK